MFQNPFAKVIFCKGVLVFWYIEKTVSSCYNFKKFERRQIHLKNTHRPAPKRQYTPESDDGMTLIGRNAVLEALNSDKNIDRIYIKSGENEGTLRVIIAKAKERNIVIKEIAKNRLDEMTGNANHQGVIASCPFVPYATIDDMFEKASAKNEQPFLIILDEIKDPHNLGAVIRTADAAGAHGVIIPARRAVGLTAAVGKTSAGAANHVLVAKVTNIAAMIDDLKKRGVWIACADMSGESIYKADLNGSIALVIGSEGEGVGRLVKERCDFAVSLPMKGELNSLNASVAAGVLMYEVVRARMIK